MLIFFASFICLREIQLRIKPLARKNFQQKNKMLVDRIEEGRHCKINVKDGHIVQKNFYLNALNMERI